MEEFYDRKPAIYISPAFLPWIHFCNRINLDNVTDIMCVVCCFCIFIYFYLLFDRHYTLSVEVNALPGKIKIYMLQYMNINWKYISLMDK